MLKIGVEHLDWDRARVVAQRDGLTVEKTAHLRGVALTVCKDADQQRRALADDIARKAREADRDIAFKLYGKEFRAHCHFQSGFWGPMTEDERRNAGLDL